MTIIKKILILLICLIITISAEETNSTEPRIQAVTKSIESRVTNMKYQFFNYYIHLKRFMNINLSEERLSDDLVEKTSNELFKLDEFLLSFYNENKRNRDMMNEIVKKINSINYSVFKNIDIIKADLNKIL